MSRLHLFGALVASVMLVFVSVAGQASVRHLIVDDNIQRVTAEFIIEGIEKANQSGDALVVIQLTTPGGLLEETENIVQAIMGSEVPVVVYVGPTGASALSAGFFITLSADFAIMAPGTSIGAAHPVLQGQEEVGEVMQDKMTNSAAAKIRGIAEQRGRNVELAEKGVTESLSFTDQEALEQGLIDYVCHDMDEILATLQDAEVQRAPDRVRSIDLTGQTVVREEMSFRQRLLSILANPTIAFLLMSLGGLGLYIEFSNPGAIVPGVFGLVCLVLAFFGLSILPVNYVGVALIILGIVLLVAEVKVVSYGMLSLGGAASLLVGSMMLIDGPIPAMRIGLGLALPVVLAIVFIVAFLLRLVMTSHRRQVSTGIEGLVGKQGVVRMALDPRGKVAVHGELWDAVSEVTLGLGDEVEVIGVEGMMLHVRRRHGLH
jgi:membrane-bound serine protease (ClpP class)